MIRSRFSLLFTAILLFFLTVFAGCTHSRDRTHGEKGIPDYRTQNAVAVYQLPDHLVRVALMPIHYEEHRADFLEGFDRTIHAELTKKALFEVIPLKRGELQERFALSQVSASRPIPRGMIERIRDEFGAQAILFIDLTHFDPYRPVALGWRARLLDVTTGQVLWQIDEVYDAGNPQVAVSAQRFQRNYEDNPYPLDAGASILQSPALFSKYTAWEVFSTLPPRVDSR